MNTEFREDLPAWSGLLKSQFASIAIIYCAIKFLKVPPHIGVLLTALWFIIPMGFLGYFVVNDRREYLGRNWGMNVFGSVGIGIYFTMLLLFLLN